jgi:hypothetical protein
VDNKIVLANHVCSIDNGFLDEMSQDNAFESSPRRLSHHDIHKIISSYDASTKAESINPKLGSGLSEIIQGSESNQHVRRWNGSKKIFVDVTFLSPINNDQANVALESVADLEVINCFQSICSVSIPIDKLEAVTSIDQVHAIHHNAPMSNVYDEKESTSIVDWISE